MTLKLALVIEGNATGAKQAAEEATRAVRQVGAATAAETINAKEFGAALKAAGNDLRQVKIDAGAAAQGIAGAGAASELAAGQTALIVRNMNEMTTMLASGRSPFQVLLTQGLQITRILGPGMGVAGAMKLIGTTIMSFVSSPLVLFTVGLAAASGAASLLWSTVAGGADDAEDSLERHDRLITRISDRYGAAADEALRFRQESQAALLYDLQQEVAERQKKLAEELKVIWAEGVGPAPGTGLFFGPLGNELLDLQRKIEAGTADVLELRESFKSIGLNEPVGSPMRELVDYVLDKTKRAADEAERLNRSLAAGYLVEHGVTPEQAARGTASLKRQLGGGAADIDSGRFDFLHGEKEAVGSGKRVADETTRAAQRAVEELKRLAETWSERAAPAIERYQRQLAKLDAAKGYFADEQGYLRARIALQNEMVDAVEAERRVRLDAATDMRSGAQRALEDYHRAALDVASGVAGAIANGFATMEDAAVAFATGAKVSIGDMARSIVADMIRIAVQQSITGPLAAGLSAALGGFMGGGASAGAAMPWSWGSFDVAQHHAGYGPGDPVRHRMVPASAFAAPASYHTGRLAPNERAAVITDDESVLTPGQMRAMGRHPVKIEIVAEPGTTARDGGQRQEGGVDVRRVIVGATAEDIATGGPLATTLEATYPGLRRRTR